MTRVSFDILSVVTTYLKNDDFGIVYDMLLSKLLPNVHSDYILHGCWLFYRSSVNEIFYYTGVPCDKVYVVDDNPDKFVYLYLLE